MPTHCGLSVTWPPPAPTPSSSLATVPAGQGHAEHAAGTAMEMLDHATGMESRRIHERIIAVRNAIGDVSDGRASAELAERIADMTGAHLRAR
jgi:hypothetical protein